MIERERPKNHHYIRCRDSDPGQFMVRDFDKKRIPLGGLHRGRTCQYMPQIYFNTHTTDRQLYVKQH